MGRIGNFLRVCDAISYSHSRGVIHRDLKPTNLMIGTYGEVYVMDWGIARLLESEQANAQSANDTFKEIDSADITANSGDLKTKFGAILGTPNYMPPEQLVGQDVGPKSDQFALGMVLFELLTFTPPREINSKAELRDKVCSGDRLPFSEAKTCLLYTSPSPRDS